MIPLTQVTGWVATYALHSTLLLGMALLATMRVESDAWRETLWKTALVGGLFTATLQTAAGFTPVVGRWTLDPFVAGRATTEAAAPRPAGNEEAPSPAEPAASGAEEPVPVVRDEAGPDASGGAAAERAVPWARVLVGVWLGLATLLLGRLVWHHVRLFRMLGDRRPAGEGGISGMLAELRRNTGYWAPVRLSVSAACPTPVALGRSEICVPERFLTELDPEQQRTALAHELAHLRRGDPLWQLAAGLVESVFFFQPLNRLARHRLRDAAENLCDDWAVQHTGSALGLARCLADIASWVGPARIPAATMAMAEGGSPLLRRVRRLAEWREPSGRAAWLRPLAAAAALAAVAGMAPTVSQADPAASRAAPAEVLASPPSHATLPDTVIVAPNPAAPLAQRWEWALRQRFPDGFWVGWSVEAGPRTPVIVLNGEQVTVNQDGSISSSSPGPGSHTRGASSLEQLVPGAVPGMAFVFGVAGGGSRAGALNGVRLRSRNAPIDLQGRPLVWLGPAGTAESLAQLRRLYATLEDPLLRKEVAAAFSLHRGEEQVVRMVREVVDAEPNAEVRSEAVQWLGREQGSGARVVELLTRIALADPSPEVRMEAVDQLVKLAERGSGEARRAVARMAASHPDSKVRSEAAQAIGRENQ